jgi:hypothetical protein
MYELYILIITITNKPSAAKMNQSLQQYRTDILKHLLSYQRIDNSFQMDTEYYSLYVSILFN